ncbi:hypothetical protein Daus18300_011428 [Diaporthe australafricana]|uniref:Uncharacterized protein n=1 Tax=Diaporthe australafricana TaxID=127596 RepID=A0ABR3W6Z7_9PEZI
MSDSASSRLRSALAPAPSQAKRSINGLSQLLSQRLSSTPVISPAASSDEPKDANDISSPPPSSGAAAAVALSRPPPPSSAVQRGGGHFAQFSSQVFEPDSTATFGDEWERLRASQGWAPGSQVYQRERARALRNELRACYFPSPSAKIEEEEEEEEQFVSKEEVEVRGEAGAGAPVAVKKKEASGEENDREAMSEAQAELLGFQAICTAVGQRPGATLEECKAALRATLVNIVDLIDAGRTGTAVHVWTDFEPFRVYTTHPDKTMPLESAKADPLLECFLKRIRPGRARLGGGQGARKRGRTEASSLEFGLDSGRERKRPRRVIWVDGVRFVSDDRKAV